MIDYEMIRKANESIKTTDIKGKDYAEVNQRIKAFRMVYPEGFIRSEMVSNSGGVCVFRAECGYYLTGTSVEAVVLGTGTAFEKQDSSFINKTSYIENCETSAVGRALGMAGYGIDVSVASYEEVANAIENQGVQEMIMPPERKASPKQIEILSKHYTGNKLEKLLVTNHIEKLEDMPISKASELCGILLRREKENG